MRKIAVSDIVIIAALSLFVCSIILWSFAAKATRYQEVNGSVLLTVQKKEFDVNAQTGGILVSSEASVGQHVTKGQEIGKLQNDSLDQQIASLSALTDNASAQVQLSQLQAQKAAQTLYSPTDGVVQSIAAQGESINDTEKVAAIYSDDAVQLVGDFTYTGYNLFSQNTTNLTSTSLRDGKQYDLEYGGTFQDVSTDKNKQSYVTLFFTFTSPNDAINVLQGEQMSLKLVNNSSANKPIDKFLNWYKNSIFNTNQNG